MAEETNWTPPDKADGWEEVALDAGGGLWLLRDPQTKKILDTKVSPVRQAYLKEERIRRREAASSDKAANLSEALENAIVDPEDASPRAEAIRLLLGPIGAVIATESGKAMDGLKLALDLVKALPDRKVDQPTTYVISLDIQPWLQIMACRGAEEDTNRYTLEEIGRMMLVASRTDRTATFEEIMTAGIAGKFPPPMKPLA